MVIQSQAIIKKWQRKQFITKLLQSVTKVYYKVSQVLQRTSGITKCDRLLIKNASGITKYDRLLLQNAPAVITKCDSYYKVSRNRCRRTWLNIITCFQFFVFDLHDILVLSGLLYPSCISLIFLIYAVQISMECNK